MPRRRQATTAGSSRQTEDAEIIGAALAISEEARERAQETLHNQQETATRREHRRRLQRLCDWLIANQAAYVGAGGVVELTEEKKQDRIILLTSVLTT